MLGSYAIDGTKLYEEQKRHKHLEAANQEMERVLKVHKDKFQEYINAWKKQQTLENSESDEKNSSADLKSTGTVLAKKTLTSVDESDKARLKILNDFAKFLYKQYPKLHLIGKKVDRDQDIIHINDYLHQRAIFLCMKVNENEKLSAYGYENYLGPPYGPPTFSNTIGYSRIAWFIINPCLWIDFLLDQTLGNIAWGWTWGVNSIIEKGAEYIGWYFNDNYRYSKGTYALKIIFNLPAIILLIPELLSYTLGLYTNSCDIWKETFSCHNRPKKVVPVYTEDKAREEARRKKLAELRRKVVTLPRSGSTGHLNLLNEKLIEVKPSLASTISSVDGKEEKKGKAAAKLIRSNSMPNLHIYSQGLFQQASEIQTLERKKGSHGKKITRISRTATGLLRLELGDASSSARPYPQYTTKTTPALGRSQRQHLREDTFSPLKSSETATVRFS